jgi:hypothetical protein
MRKYIGETKLTGVFLQIVLRHSNKFLKGSSSNLEGFWLMYIYFPLFFATIREQLEIVQYISG